MRLTGQGIEHETGSGEQEPVHRVRRRTHRPDPRRAGPADRAIEDVLDTWAAQRSELQWQGGDESAEMRLRRQLHILDAAVAATVRLRTRPTIA